jgi:hypothetical protein
MRLRDLLADLLGVLCLFGMAYAMLFLGAVFAP